MRVRVSIRLVARHAKSGREAAVETPAAEAQAVELPGGAGGVRVWLAERTDSTGSLVLRLRCKAEMPDGWVLYEAALAFELDPAGWSLLLPSGWGREVDPIPADLDFVGNYPGWSALAQLVILQSADGGLSVSATDAGLELKELRARMVGGEEGARLRVEITRVPEKHGDSWLVMGLCDVLLSPHAGGWEVAAADYRRRQEQIRPGLARPREPHVLVQADPVWLVHDCFAFPPHTMEDLLAAAAALEAPVLCHYYNWADAPFDTRYPDWVGFRDGAVERMRRLAAAGIPTTPYLNGRCWDTTTESYRRQGRPAAVRDVAGEVVTEIYPTSHIDLGVICPSSQAYRARIVEAAGRLAGSGADLAGVYLDQLGAAFGLRCYGDGHDHAGGGAKSWNAGQREMVAGIRRRWREAAGTEPMLTTENASEPLVDLLDGFLYYCGRRDDGLGRPAPLWQAIYGDVGGCFGDDYGKDFSMAEGRPPDRLVRRLARQAIFGNSLGWVAPQLVLGEYEAVGRLIRSARSARLEHLPCFRGGLPCTDALDSTGERAGVFLSAWRADGATAALAVNPSGAPAEFRWPDGHSGRLPAWSAEGRRLD